MFTQDMLDGFVALAGDDFAWAGVKGCHRPASDVRRALRADLIARQGGICFDCGEMLDDTAEFCHIVSRGPARKGWMPGNIGIGHSACNERQKDRSPIVQIADMTRPDVIVTDWLPFPILRRM